MRERTGDEGSGAASWKLEESAEAFTFRLRKEEKEEEESLVLLFLSYFYFAIVGRDVRIDPSFHINFRSKEIEFHREQKIFSISYFFF